MRTNELIAKRKRRSALQKEFEAMQGLIEILKPLSPEQRRRMIATANEFLGGGYTPSIFQEGTDERATSNEA